VHCTKISPELDCQGQRSKVKVTQDKNEKVRHFVWESSSGDGPRAAFFPQPSSGAPLRRLENQIMLSSD